NGVDALHGVFRSHGPMPSEPCGDAVAAATDGTFIFWACCASPYSFENRTSPAPSPANTMPTYNVQCGDDSGKWKFSAEFASGCQNRLTNVFITGAVAKITGATKMRGPLNSNVAKMTHKAPKAPAAPASVASVTPEALHCGIFPRIARMAMGNRM